jgi:hypothetical protein
MQKMIIWGGTESAWQISRTKLCGYLFVGNPKGNDLSAFS